jgi:hypothetical protein
VFAKQEKEKRSPILQLWHSATAPTNTLSALPPGVGVYRSGPLHSSGPPRSCYTLLYQPLLTQLPSLHPPRSPFVLLWRRKAQATPNRESKSEHFRMPRESAWRRVASRVIVSAVCSEMPDTDIHISIHTYMYTKVVILLHSNITTIPELFCFYCFANISYMRCLLMKCLRRKHEKKLCYITTHTVRYTLCASARVHTNTSTYAITHTSCISPAV